MNHFQRLMLWCGCLVLPVSLPAQERWVATWTAAPMAVKNDHLGESETTLRNIVHLSIGGQTLRIAVSNEFGTEPLVIKGASVGESAAGGGLKGSASRVTFAGQPSVTLAPGTMRSSDPVPFVTQPLENLAVSLVIPAQKITELSQHNASHDTNYAAPGDQLMQPAFANAKELAHWPFLKGVSVLAPADVGALVCFGDSITDGTGSTTDGNDRWPDDLSAWLAAHKTPVPVAVVNEGIGGNRILHDNTGPAAVDRFTRDVLAQDGVRSVIVLEGINDISHTNASFPDTYLPVSADDIIGGLKKLALAAHAHGLKIYVATITPYLGAKYYWSGGEAVRVAVNGYLRGGKDFDGVIDFDRLLAQPGHPEALVTAYEHGDHLHPSPAGYRLMAEEVERVVFPERSHAPEPASLR